MPLRSTPLLLVSALFLFLVGGQALTGQPPPISGQIETVLADARTAASPAELEAARAELLALSKRHPRDLLPAFPDRSRALVEAAALGRRLGATNAAAGELLQVLEREPGSEWTPRAHLELAEVLLDRGDWRLAADHLAAGSRRRPGSDRRRDPGHPKRRCDRGSTWPGWRWSG